MDSLGDAVNLADEDCVKNTQFFTDDCSGSQVRPTPEPRLVYGSSQPGVYSNSLVVPYPSVRPHQVTNVQGGRCPPVSQLSYGQQNAWPNYGPGYGSGVHPMQQLLVGGMYPQFVPGSYGGIAPHYVGASPIGEADNFLLSQMGHVPRLQHNVEWLKTHNLNAPGQELLQNSPATLEPQRTVEPHPLSTRAPTSSGGPWFCPRSSRRDHREPQQISANEDHVPSVHTVPGGGNKNDRPERKAAQRPLELRQSAATESTETHEGPVRSDSIDVGRSVGVSKERRAQSHVTTPSQSTVGLRRGTNNSSKSVTPNCLNARRALREDEKSFLKEVKIAISEGRVPRVTVEQDGKGNIVRFRAQFLNALKLAAHAVVQGAYIDINEQDSMNEIMKEVKRQFILLQPLPMGMVERYLKGHFKRCRAEYHKFWIKHGDKKSPDGCKKAAWLQLVEYWKSLEGSKECEKNRRNASTGKPNLKRNQNSDVDCFVKESDGTEEEAMGSPVHRVQASDSLGFDYMTPLKTRAPSPTSTRNPMADISNQLHNAVDNILSSFASQCHSLPSTNIETGNNKAPIKPLGNQCLKSGRVGTRTASEVLESLQRPGVGEFKKDVNQFLWPNIEGLSHIPEKLNYSGMMRSEQVRVSEVEVPFDMKVYENDSSARGKGTLEGNIGEFRGGSQTKCSAQRKVGVVKEEAVILSSDESSDGLKLKTLQTQKKQTPEDVFRKPNKVYTEEIEGWPLQSTDTVSVANRRGKEAITKDDETTKKSKFEGQKLVHGWHDSVKVTLSKNLGPSSSKDDVHANSNLESQSEEDYEENDARIEEFQDLSEEDEPPVLPREIVKRKLEGQYGSSSGNKELKCRSVKRSNQTQQKKQRITQIDSAVLKKLEFYKRPKNANPIKTRTRVWVLHPKYVGKVVAEAYAGVNRKSRCVDSANEICKEGQQLISVVRVLYKNTPVMYDPDSRFPKQISYLDQVEGVPNTPILWCVSHLIEIPLLDQVTRLFGQIMKPQSQDTVNSDSDFENSRNKRESISTIAVGKDRKKGRVTNGGSNVAQGAKVSRTMLRSSNA